MEDPDQAINVPFIDHSQLDYGGKKNNSQLADDLIQREFGQVDQLIVTKDRVELDGETLVNIADDGIDQGKNNNTGASPAKGESRQESFILRRIDNGDGLRIAVQTSLNLTQRPALRDLITDLKKIKATDYEIDLTFCPDMTITGLGILLLIRKNISEGQKNITVKNCNEFILQLLKWAGMEEYFLLQGK